MSMPLPCTVFLPGHDRFRIHHRDAYLTAVELALFFLNATTQEDLTHGHLMGIRLEATQETWRAELARPVLTLMEQWAPYVAGPAATGSRVAFVGYDGFSWHALVGTCLWTAGKQPQFQDVYPKTRLSWQQESERLAEMAGALFPRQQWCVHHEMAEHCKGGSSSTSILAVVDAAVAYLATEEGSHYPGKERLLAELASLQAWSGAVAISPG